MKLLFNSILLFAITIFMSCSPESSHDDGDNLVELNDAQDISQSPAVDITGASVEAVLTDEADDSALAVSPVAMPEYPAPATNDYRGSFFASTANGFSVGQRVKIDIDFDAGAGLRRHFVFVAIVCE